MFIKKCFFIFLGIVWGTVINAQSSPESPDLLLQKIKPMSPTAASLSKFGDIPVNYYSGSPSISIPLFKVGSGQLEVPVSLNYQFNGLKTEELASWVGLGWSLNAGGVIGRTIRGTADEDNNGYMIPGRMSVQYMINNPSDPNVIDNLILAGKGLFDTEPDIFYFNFLGYSGKFYFNQEDQQFHSLPIENISISFDSNNNSFTIITPDGNKFLFDKREVTTNSGPSCNGSVPPANSYSSSTTAWFLSSIKNSNENDEISFSYNSAGSYYVEHTNQESKYILRGMSGSWVLNPPDFNYERCTQSSQINFQRLEYINFRGGYIKFVASVTDRCDLPGDKSLDYAELYDSKNNLIKKFSFNYGYFGDYGVPNACSYPNNLSLRLKLTGVQEESTTGVQLINPYQFVYEESAAFPSRLSFSQDYWGYNNGMNNQALIPSFIYTSNTGIPTFFPGANRRPDFNASKLGSIKKITYPTGGSTEFEFENNEVSDPQVEPSVELRIQTLEGDHVGLQTYYENTFVVNEPPSQMNNFLGGAFVEIGVSEPGCDITQGTTCAVLSLEGLTPGTNGIGNITAYNFNGFYLPNGTYKMKANFNQVPAMFQDFYYYIKWDHAIFDQSYLVGGIRLKKMTDFDGYNTSNKVIKLFNYTSDETTLSSGKVFSYPYDFSNEFNHVFWTLNEFDDLFVFNRSFQKLTSTSKYPLISSGAGYVGYGQVNVTYGESGEGGTEKFYFTNIPDLLETNFPVFSINREWKRGMLTKKVTKESSGYEKSTIQNGYYQFDEYDQQITKVSNGLRLGFNKGFSFASSTPVVVPAVGQMYYDYSIPMYNEFETYAGKSVLSSSQSTLNESPGSITTHQEITYSNKNFLPVTSSNTNSKSGQVIVKTKYVGDYAVSSGPVWLNLMREQKINELPIEKLTIEKRQDNTEYVTGGVIIFYKNDKPAPDKIYKLELTTPLLLSSITQSYVDGGGNFVMDNRYKEVVQFNQYDQYNNLLSQQKKDDVVSSFIWGYNSKYVVAQIIGKTYDEAVSQSGINLSILNDPPDEAAMRTELNKLYALQGALVTSYVYKPLIGISSETDPNHISRYYEYDGLGRLIIVRDNDNNIVKSICYNYFGLTGNCGTSAAQTTFYNVETSQTFTKNNCTGCDQGGQVVYTVPANTYSSTVSLAAANQLAQDDINANGQNYANTNGSCTPGTSLSYNNLISGTADTGFTATYTNNHTGQVYAFSIPGNGSGVLGCIPTGIYSLTITKPGNGISILFGTGCMTQAGVSASYGKVVVSSCSQVTMQLDLQQE